MSQRPGWTAVAAAILAVGLVPAAGAGEEASVVAIVDGTPITLEALDDRIQAELTALRHREDQLRRQGLGDLVAEVLVAREAQERGMSVEELTRIEIVDKARVTPAEASAFYEVNIARFGRYDRATAIQQIAEGLGQERERERRAAFARELRNKYPVEVRLEPFRVEVGTGEGPLRGNPEAPVTIVEFSDFQCPYCVRVRPIVNRVREVYGDQLRYAFRHFPLAFHELAEKAGEAAACAGDQGRFWDMHDWLWENQSRLTVPDLKQHAAALGLDTTAFAQCLDSGRHAALVKNDTEAGERLGVTGTPAFFINGRAIVGAQSFEAFAQVIDDELKRAGRTPTRASVAP